MKNSYEKAILESMSKKTSQRVVECGQLPRHISSSSFKQAVDDPSYGVTPLPPRLQGSGGHKGGNFPQIPDVGISGIHGGKGVTAGVVMSKQPPSRIHQGFMPSSSGPFDATKSVDLPGSRSDGEATVITTPPHSQSIKTGSGQTVGRSRAKSIEDVDKSRENYVPGVAKKPNGDGGETSNSFCLGLSSLIISQDTGHVTSEGVNASRKQKAMEESDTSTISVRSSSCVCV